MAASAIVMALQTIVSRNVNPLHTGIISVGASIAGDAPNVIPGVAELRLTVRAFRPDVRDLLEKRITEIAQTQAAVFSAKADVDYIRRYPVLNNHARETAFCQQLIRDWLGGDAVLSTGATYWVKLAETWLGPATVDPMGSGGSCALP